MRTLGTSVSLCLAFLFAASPALAISGAGAIVLEFNTSVRAEGMGGAGVAVPWGGDVNEWANPALLAFRPGLRYETLRSHLVPELADDIYLHGERITAGGPGYGVLFSHGPLEGTAIDMGLQQATGDDGSSAGTFDSWMRARQYGFGLELMRLVRGFGGVAKTGLLSRLDVAAGAVWKDFEDRLAPDWVLHDATGGSARARAHDLGLLASLRAIDSRGDADGFANEIGGVMLGAAYGISTLNTGEAWIVHVDAAQADPFPKLHVKGWALRAETGFPTDLRARLDDAGRGWIADALTPLLAVTYSKQTIQPGITWDGDALVWLYERDECACNEERSSGWELAFANVVFIRRGHREIESAFVDGDTRGWGVRLPFGRWGGMQYDTAEVPQATGLGNVERESFSVWVDVFGLLDQE